MSAGRPFGSVPEVIEDGRTGFIVADEAGAVAAGGRLAELSRDGVRWRFEQRFTATRMAQDYLAVYRSLMQVEAPRPRLVTGMRARG